MAALQPLANQRYTTFLDDCWEHWEIVGDSHNPGYGGGGYAAGAAVLNAHIQAITAYKNAKGW